MATINTSRNKICTLINVFTVKPERQMELFENLKQATEKAMSRMPGYISANIHLGDDGKTVTNYAQWATAEDYQNVFKDEQVQKHIKEAAAIAIEFKPVTYGEIWTHLK